MAHPVILPKKSHFFPIGFTPPVCLTQGLSPEKNADILLLGCGDPRSILYTVYADLAHGNRLLDFTCCDWEPAVLARNILLLTMIVDGVSADTAWSIFFHFFLDEASRDILIAQCRILIQSSSDMKTWKDSKYGTFLRFSTKHSLSEIRHHWILYAKSKDLSQSEHETWKAFFYSEMKSSRDKYIGDVMPATRTAGPLYLHIINKAHELHTSFWTTGITKSSASQVAAAPYVNPTFAYSLSGKGFNVHYGIDPITAFFMVPALASGITGKSPSSITIEDLGDCAKTQFSAWCSSFKTRLAAASTANIVIRFFVGEALACCQALHICKEQQTTETTIYAQPWKGMSIVFEAGDYGGSSAVPVAPLLFNVIETSNLADHIGLLNVLVATVPLLDKKPWSILHTNTLLRSNFQGPAKSGLSERACADILTLSMLLGIAPSPHLWHFTTQSNKHEIIISSRVFSDQLRETISWQFVSSFAPNAVSERQDTELGHFALLCDPEKLAEFFFSVYLRMFENESIAMKNSSTPESFNKKDDLHYISASFVAFLALVKGSVRTDWNQTMRSLLSLIERDRSLSMGSGNYHDIVCHLYMRNVYTSEIFSPSFLTTLRTPHDRFHGWSDIPPVVCIVLKVPRQELRILESMDADSNKVTMPIFQCETSSSNFRNIHSLIHLAFGSTRVFVVDGEPQVTIEEDPKGWNGDSSLIATFYLPSSILTGAPTFTQVGLHVRSTAPAFQLVTPRGGVGLTIFSTPLTDAAHVHVVRHRQNNAEEMEYLRDTPAYSPSTQSVRDIMVKFDDAGQKATHLIVRKNITDPAAARSLASGSEISVTPVADSSVLVTFGGHSHRIRFFYPFPIQMKRLQTRIARKSSYIEIESRIRPDFNDVRDLSLNPFAVAHDDKQINLLNVHYLNLDILPALLLPSEPKDLELLSVHAAMMFSVEERKAREVLSLEDQGPLLNLKETIACLILKSAEVQQDRLKFFGFRDTQKDGIYILIFVNEIKFDLASHTVVIDACVVPLDPETMLKVFSALYEIRNRGLSFVVDTLPAQTRAWKLFLPLLSERCRTWKHTGTCEYRTAGVPASLEGFAFSPLCSCGKGKNLGRFGTVSEWKILHEQATRIAIGPLFTFSFMEKMPDPLLGNIHNSPSNSPECAKCGGTGKPKLLACSACKKIRYCSSECQKAHWKIHKQVCAKAN